MSGERRTSPRPMSAADIVQAVRAAGIDVAVEGGDLLLKGVAAPPPDDLLDAMRGHKAEILALLRGEREDASTSRGLLGRLGVEAILIEDEPTAEREITSLLAETRMVGLDVETAPRPEHVTDAGAALNPLKAEVGLLQLATASKALVVDLRKVPLSSPALAPVWTATLVGHNLSFDAKMLLANGLDLSCAKMVDTILLSGLYLRGEPDRGREGTRRPPLAVAVAEALGVKLPKEMQRSDWSRDGLTSEQIAYAALDAVMARRLFAHFARELEMQPPAPDGVTLSDRLDKAVLPVARIELAGVTLDVEALSRLDAEWNSRVAQLRGEITARFGVRNPNSAPQVEAWLGGELCRLGIRAWSRTPAGKLSTQAKHLKRLVGISPGIELLLEFSRVQQLASNFGRSLIHRVGSDGRLRANFQIAGAKTGRFTSSKPNLQNIPRPEEIRSLFVAAPGRSLVCADYSQLELRVMATISGDEKMTAAYREGRDLHAITAAGMLGVAVEDFDAGSPTHAEARKKAKAINFGIIFGCGPEGLREFARDAYGVVLSAREADDMITGFLRTYRGVASWMGRQNFRARRDGFIQTVGGRSYPFAWEAGGRFSRNLAFNLPIQGTAAEIAIEAVICIDARLRRELPAGKLVLQVHDEFVLEVPQDYEELAKRILVEEMTAAFSALLPDAPVRGLVDAHAGPNWAAAKG